MKGVKYVSWADTTGYAVAAKAYIRALARHGVELTWEPMLPCAHGYEVRPGERWDDSLLASLAGRDADVDTVLIHTVPEYYPQWIEKEHARNRKVFGYTVWELEALPDHWPAILNRLDGVIVPCTWNADVFRRSGVEVPVHVVPHLSQFPDADVAAPPRERGDPFVFYTIGYWSNRKAPYLVAEAFRRAFGKGDAAALVIKTSRNDITRWHRHWRNGFRRHHPSPVRSLARLGFRSGPGTAIEVIADETLSDAQMLALHRRGDCFVSLARSEGWGLGAFEAARLARPVITTGYGGQLDYLDADLAHLVDYRLVPVHEPTWSANYRPTDLWAEPSLDHAARLMRHVYEHREDAAARAVQLAERIRARFSEEAVVAAMVGALG